MDVRNPFYEKLVSRIYFTDVDLIVFCTKNPIPIEKYLSKIKIPFIIHVTLTPYKKEIEENVPNKKLIINSIKRISKQIGKDKIYIRYDPIFISDTYNISYHIKAFNRLCTVLDGYVEHIIISFIDEYRNVEKNKKILNLKEITNDDYKLIGTSFSKMAKLHNMTVQTCCEENNLVEYGFIKKDCLDFNLAYKLTGKTKFKKWKSRSCGCVEMVDIASYNMCSHFCKYCYANFSEEEIITNMKKHNPSSSLIKGELKSTDIIKVRKT